MKYKYKYSVAKKGEAWYYTEHDADGSYTPPANITLEYYYRCINNNGAGWERLLDSSKKFTATSIGTYTIEIAWMKLDYIDVTGEHYITEGRKGYDKRTIVITELTITTQYRLLVSLSGGSNKTAFDINSWTLTATVTAQYKEGSGSWTNTTTPSGISYSWTGASSTSSTATVGVSSVSMGSDGSHLGTKNVTVTVSLSGYTGDSATVTLGRYGKSYYNG